MTHNLDIERWPDAEIGPYYAILRHGDTPEWAVYDDEVVARLRLRLHAAVGGTLTARAIEFAEVEQGDRDEKS